MKASRAHLALLGICLGCGGAGTPAHPVDAGVDVGPGAPDAEARDGAVDAAAESAPPPPPPPRGEPLVTEQGKWTFVPFGDAVCNDGSTTGLAVNLASSDDVAVFFWGGGACWDYGTCYALKTATLGPIGEKEAASFYASTKGTIFDRDDADNPLRDFSFIVIPYCTGDVHSGNTVGQYESEGTLRPFHHKGRANAEAFAKRIGGTFASPRRVLVAGASAGGFGATFNYDLFRSYFPSAKMYLLNDSAPPLVGDDILETRRNAWYSAWNMGPVIDPLCPGCSQDFSAIVPTLATRYPNDRSALLSYTQDSVIRMFVGKSQEGYEEALSRLAEERFTGQPMWQRYIVSGTKHTMVRSASTVTSEGVLLRSWLSTFINDDPNWRSIEPVTTP